MMDFLDQSLMELATALHKGETCSEELVSEAIARHSEYGAQWNAYRTWDPDFALEQARAADHARRCGFSCGPMDGLPVSVKDLYGVRGYPTYAGMARALSTEWTQEGFLVGTIRSQHAVVMGKTHTVEMALSGLGMNPHWGTPFNPWCTTEHRVPGGSSSGAGVSLLEGSAVVALGTDTACSLRVPAAWTGTVGFKTTHGRWPADGIVPLSPTLDVVGAITRSVNDAAFFFSAIDPRHGDPFRFFSAMGDLDISGIRIGTGFSRVWERSQEDIIRTVEEALHELESHGARLADIQLPEFDAACDLYARGTIVLAEGRAFLLDRLPERLNELHKTVGLRLQDGARITSDEYLLALSERQRLAASAQNRLPLMDVLAIPTVAISPPTLSQIEKLGDYFRFNRQTSWTTNPVNMLNLCAISIPCGLDRVGMPVGLQLIAGSGDDEKLLAIALAIEKVLGTPEKRLGCAWQKNIRGVT